jgi:hypothetical protein
MLFVCSGIAVHRNGHVIKLLTSASLLKAFNDARKDHDNLKVGAANHPLLFFLLT